MDRLKWTSRMYKMNENERIVWYTKRTVLLKYLKIQLDTENNFAEDNFAKPSK